VSVRSHGFVSDRCPFLLFTTFKLLLDINHTRTQVRPEAMFSGIGEGAMVFKSALAPACLPFRVAPPTAAAAVGASAGAGALNAGSASAAGGADGDAAVAAVASAGAAAVARCVMEHPHLPSHRQYLLSAPNFSQHMFRPGIFLSSLSSLIFSLFPLLLSRANSHFSPRSSPAGSVYKVVFKSGDDLRQDQARRPAPHTIASILVAHTHHYNPNINHRKFLVECQTCVFDLIFFFFCKT
jgi:hypothetical protein